MVYLGVWSCPSHHCDDCARAATMSCAFCPSAFCSEHCHGKMRLSEYYQLTCQKHDDIVLCDDPNVLKIFGLCKSPKTPSSRKPLRHKSGSSVKRTRGEGEDANLSSADRSVSDYRTPKHKRKFDASISEARERSPPKRSCRDLDVKTKEQSDPTLSLDHILAQLGGKNADDAKRPKTAKTEQRRDDGRRESSETGQKRRHHSLEKDSNRTVHSGSSPSSESLKKDRKHVETEKSGHHRQAVESKDVRKDKKAFDDDRSQRGKHEQQKQRRVKDSELTGESAAASLKFSSSTVASSSSSLLLAVSSGTGRANKWSPAGKSAVTPAKSLDDEPLFDNSDDEFPELIIDVP